MILTLVLSVLVMLCVIAGMSIGVINGRGPIRGSCGGVSSGGCELCSGKRCPRRSGAGE